MGCLSSTPHACRLDSAFPACPAGCPLKGAVRDKPLLAQAGPLRVLFGHSRKRGAERGFLILHRAFSFSARDVFWFLTV